MKTKPPVVVIGGGHAGVEAAAAAARMGCDVVLLTLDPKTLVRLSCNPAVGGIGKGHLVREIDALGGVMGLAADLGGIHFRVLNSSRGSAVQGPRAQQDYDRYPGIVGGILDRYPNLEVIAGEAIGLAIENGRLVGVQTSDGRTIRCEAAVLTTGTFLRGRMYQGEQETEGGRVGESAAIEMSGSLAACGVRLDRFKTGTPPRLVADSIDTSSFDPQPGDDVPVPFSFAHLASEFEPPLRQTVTHLAKTGPAVHRIVRENLHRSPLYTGRIQSLGPRYCPSFEDKVVKFSEKPSHLLHLEPMGLEHPWVYVNGLSTSLPPETQTELVSSIEGLERAEIARFGYAVEYDYVPPTQLTGSLQLRSIQGLFLAGQICGTTGYEEAAGLGLIAGVNAALFAMGKDAWVPDRLQSYLGVMATDLTTTGVLEPYRMFTSRAEMRLSLSADTADARLTPVGAALGLVEPSQSQRADQRWLLLNDVLSSLERGTALRGPRSATPADRIRKGEAGDPWLAEYPLSPFDRKTVLSLVQYRGYLEREQREIARLRDLERVRVPEEFAFDLVPGLSHEIRQRLSEVRPTSLSQAARIPGVNPASITVLAAAIVKHRRAIPPR
ncbi:MAG: tRNA uridine-5-carboxymethylaminomethyl(34) synthesis enzyme MnmG [Acidobacteriota bacterium]